MPSNLDDQTFLCQSTRLKRKLMQRIRDGSFGFHGGMLVPLSIRNRHHLEEVLASSRLDMMSERRAQPAEAYAQPGSKVAFMKVKTSTKIGPFASLPAGEPTASWSLQKESLPWPVEPQQVQTATVLFCATTCIPLKDVIET